MPSKDQHFQAFATELRRAVKNLKAGDLFAGLPATMWSKRASALLDGNGEGTVLQVAACLYMAHWVAAGRPAAGVQDDDDEEAMPA